MSSNDPLLDLLKALSSADQEKEGAFRVRTWKMVIEEIVKFRDQLQETDNKVRETPSAEEIREAVKSDIQRNLATEDEGKVLF